MHPTRVPSAPPPLSLVCALPVLLAAGPALAYIGPGAGITLIGSVIGLAVALALAFAMAVAWPVRAWRRQRRARAAQAPAPGRDRG